jgi:hypothetical protein
MCVFLFDRWPTENAVRVYKRLVGIRGCGSNGQRVLFVWGTVGVSQ